MVRNWSSVLKESNAAITSCPQLFACEAEALLKLHKLDDADFILLNVPKLEALSSRSCSKVKFFEMLSEAYLLFVRAQIDMSLGRFERAISSIEKSGEIDPRNVEVAVLLQNIRFHPLNPIIHYNQIACWLKLKQYERSLDDCNQALLFYPNYKKALIRRAATFSKDYEVLRRELPDNNDIAESLFHAQVALLKKLLEDEVYNMKFGGDVETITNHEQFKVTVSSTGASVALFKRRPDLQGKQISQFLDTICARYPIINFLKV
ncbi:TPR repeat-containing thioredoxin TTL1-like protein [Tanacetum coccineum]